jgi:hypothetical protein
VCDGIGFSLVKMITSCLSDDPTLKVTDLEQLMPLDPHGTFCQNKQHISQGCIIQIRLNVLNNYHI